MFNKVLIKLFLLFSVVYLRWGNDYGNIKRTRFFYRKFIWSNGLFSSYFSWLLIVIESILPILPLAVFITLNIYYFGAVLGFLISWILTCVGCYISFYLFRNKVKFWFDKRIIERNRVRLNKLMTGVDKLKFEQLTLLIANPFTPAFMINIVAGLSSMKKRKFISSILIGKIFLVIFWGFIGTSLIDSLKDPFKVLYVVVLSVLAYIVSKIINKKYNIE